MYAEFFGLRKMPFTLSPDPDTFFLSHAHDLALAHLEYGILHKVGFLALTGEVGAGKTTLLKILLEKIKDALDIALVFNTNLDPRALLEMLVREFELSPRSHRKSDLFETLYDHFLRQYAQGTRCVILQDEAQNLPLESLEELRMLSNLETGSDLLLQIILVGQPQLRRRLTHPSLAQLAQRISVYYHLSALSAEEVHRYVLHRLRKAGYDRAEPLFLQEAVDLVAERSGGIPRLINALCDASLTYAFSDDLPHVSASIVAQVIEDNPVLVASVVDGDGAAEPASAPDPQGAPPAPPEVSGLRTDLSRAAAQIEALERRVRLLESGEQNGAVGVLRDLLSRERDRSVRLEQEVTTLRQKYQAALLELKELRGGRRKK